jgi:hypothetical protein
VTARRRLWLALFASYAIGRIATSLLVTGAWAPRWSTMVQLLIVPLVQAAALELAGLIPRSAAK